MFSQRTNTEGSSRGSQTARVKNQTNRSKRAPPPSTRLKLRASVTPPTHRRLKYPKISSQNQPTAELRPRNGDTIIYTYSSNHGDTSASSGLTGCGGFGGGGCSRFHVRSLRSPKPESQGWRSGRAQRNQNLTCQPLTSFF